MLHFMHMQTFSNLNDRKNIEKKKKKPSSNSSWTFQWNSTYHNKVLIKSVMRIKLKSHNVIAHELNEQ